VTADKTCRQIRKTVYVNIAVKLSLTHMAQLHGEKIVILDVTTPFRLPIHTYRAKSNLNFT